MDIQYLIRKKLLGKDSDINKKIIQLLKKNINSVDSNNKTALIIAAENYYNGLAKYLVQHIDCNITLTDNNNYDALYYGIIKSNFEICDLLIKTKKFNLNKYFNDESYLNICIKNTSVYVFDPDHNKILKLLISNGSDVNMLNSEDMNAFMIACYHKEFASIKILIDDVTNINYKSKKFDCTAFEFLFDIHIMKNNNIINNSYYNFYGHISYSKFDDYIGIADFIISKRPEVNTFADCYINVFDNVCSLIFNDMSSGFSRYLSLFKKLIKDGLNIDNCFSKKGFYQCFKIIHEYVFNFKISNKKISYAMVQFDEIYSDILFRIEYNKSFLNSKILKKQISKINYEPLGYKTLFLELSFPNKININDMLKEHRFYKLKLLFDIYNSDDLDNFLKKYESVDDFNIL